MLVWTEKKSPNYLDFKN